MDILGNLHDISESECQINEERFLGLRMRLLQNDSNIWCCSARCEKDVDKTLEECNSKSKNVNVVKCCWILARANPRSLKGDFQVSE